MLSFLRSDLAQLMSYTPHPGGADSADPNRKIDRLDTNESPYDLPEDLKEKLAGIYQNLIETNRYPDGAHVALKEAIATYVNEGIKDANSQSLIKANQISIGNGSDELIRALLIATCLQDEGSILVAEPTFSMYAILAKTLGISVTKIPRSPVDFSMDIAAANAAIQQDLEPLIRAIFVVHPNSPTGNALTPAELEWLRTIPHDMLVVIDEAYYEFSQQTVVGELYKRPNWLVLRTFSKAFRLASLRVGYAIGHPDAIAALEKIRLPYNLPSFSQAAAELTLANRHKLLTVIPEIITERNKLIKALANHPTLKIWPSDSNFIYARLKDDNQSEKDLNQIMYDLKVKGTLVRHTGGGLRITVGTPEENQRTLERLQEISN